MGYINDEKIENIKKFLKEKSVLFSINITQVFRDLESIEIDYNYFEKKSNEQTEEIKYLKNLLREEGIEFEDDEE